MSDQCLRSEGFYVCNDDWWMMNPVTFHDWFTKLNAIWRFLCLINDDQWLEFQAQRSLEFRKRCYGGSMQNTLCRKNCLLDAARDRLLQPMVSHDKVLRLSRDQYFNHLINRHQQMTNIFLPTQERKRNIAAFAVEKRTGQEVNLSQGLYLSILIILMDPLLGRSW